jgi:hypothetical protein
MHNEEKIRMVKNDLIAAFNDIGRKHNIVLNMGTLSYNDLYFTVSLKGRFLDAQGTTEAADKALWDFYAAKFGLKSEWFGKTITIGTHTYKIVGIAPKARKYPVIGEEHGKKFKLTSAEVVIALAKPVFANPVLVEELKKAIERESEFIPEKEIIYSKDLMGEPDKEASGQD